MQKRDAFPFRAHARNVVDEVDARVATSLQRSVEVIYREADVVDTGSALGQETADGRIGSLRLEQFDDRITGCEPADSGFIDLGELRVGHSEDVAIERHGLSEGLYGDADVGDSRSTVPGV